MRFELSGPKELVKKNLHSLWDSLLLLDNLGINSRPINTKTAQFIEELADTITMAYPKELFCDQHFEPAIETWAKESFEAGIEAYQGIEPYTEPSQEYLAIGYSSSSRETFLKYSIFFNGWNNPLLFLLLVLYQQF